MKQMWDKIKLKEYLNEKRKQSFSSEDYKKFIIGEFLILKDGEPCNHKGCLNHMKHPCEGCDRIGGSSKLTREYYERKKNF